VHGRKAVVLVLPAGGRAASAGATSTDSTTAVTADNGHRRTRDDGTIPPLLTWGNRSPWDAFLGRVRPTGCGSAPCCGCSAADDRSR